MKPCEIKTFKDDEGDWIAKCTNHEHHKYLSGIARYRKNAIIILNDVVRMAKEMDDEDEMKQKEK
jgi:hypothetical protein